MSTLKESLIPVHLNQSPFNGQCVMCYTATQSTRVLLRTSLDPWASVNFILLDQRTENKQFINAYWQYLWVSRKSVPPFLLILLPITQIYSMYPWKERLCLSYLWNEPRPGTTSPQRDPSIVHQNRPGKMNQMTQHQPSQTTLFEKLRSYPFSTDSEFSNGLSIILGHPGSPANEAEVNREDDLVLQAKCFYFSRYGHIHTSHAATSLTLIYLLGKKVSHHPLTLQPIEPG